MKNQIQCNCGKVQGELEISGRSNRVICYCKDCQAFANYLQNNNSILDQWGGTEIVQMSPSRIKFIRGIKQIRCLRLSQNGLLRWYTGCCDTPIANTTPNFKFSFVGLIHSCIKADDVEKSFGKIGANLSTNSATRERREFGLLTVIAFFLTTVLVNRVHSKYKNNPFFDENGQAIVEPTVLSESGLNSI